MQGNKSIEPVNLRQHNSNIIASTIHRNKSTILTLVLAHTLTEYGKPLIQQLIEEVTVYEDKFTVEFKSGVTVDVDG